MRPSGSASELGGRWRAGQQTAREITLDALTAIQAADGGSSPLNIFLSVDHEWSLAEADAVDARGARGSGLEGIPVAVKDNIATTELPTTCGSRLLEGYRSPFDATAVRRLRDAGAIVIGKTNMDEFGMGSSTEYSAFGATRNPRDPSRVPGGSSGGSAAAVAAGICPIALGSETGGSVRQPAAFCGITGIKPTYGRVSRYGLVAYASSLDHIGVFGATVRDAALGLQAIVGHDPRDATSSRQPVPDLLAALDRPLAGLVIGRPREYFPSDLDQDIAGSCDAVLERLRAAGAIVRDVSLPQTHLAIPAYYIIAPAEASSNLSRFDGVRFGRREDSGQGLRAMYDATRSHGFGPEVTRRILLGTYVLSAGYYDAYYKRAMQVRRLIADDFQRVFASGVDLLLTPTTPTCAFPIGSVHDPYTMYLSDVFTVTANLAGIPAMSVPAGVVHDLPVGVQLMAPHFAEARLVAVAQHIERLMSEGGA